MKTKFFIVVALFVSVSASLFGDDLESKHKQMVYPVVRVSYGASGGSGTIIYSENRSDENEYETFVLTNHHVVSDAIQIVTEWSSLLGREIKQEKRKTVKVEVFRYEDMSIMVGRESFDADIKAYSEDHDLALLQLRTSRPFDYAAKLKPKERSEKVYLFDPVIVVGCSLFHPPLISTGEFTSLNDEIDGKGFWMTNAQCVYGNSGGAAFTKDGDNWVMIGIPSRVAVIDWGTPITHMGYLIPLPRIYQWLENEHLTFLCNESDTPKQCFIIRKNLAKDAFSVPPTEEAPPKKTFPYMPRPR